MFKIVARMVVKKDKIADFKSTAKDLIAKSQNEEGNVFYSLNQDAKNEQKFAFIECWKDEEAMQIHGASEHFTKYFPILAEMCESSDEMELYTEVEF